MNTLIQLRQKVTIRMQLGVLILLLASSFAILPFSLSAQKGILHPNVYSIQAAEIGIASTQDSITLHWTSPGDDGATGTATLYDIRYSTSVITDLSWNLATSITGAPVPQIAGTQQSKVVTGLQPNTTYYFGLKTSDEAGNWSELSNIATSTTLAISIPGCLEDWRCNAWDTCTNGRQTRICTDNNACGTFENQPVINRSCTGNENPNEDSVAPNTVLRAAPMSTLTIPRFNFMWEGIDDITAIKDLKFSFRLDSGSWSNWSSAQQYTARRLMNGNHSFEVRAQDEAGNIDPSPALVRFSVRKNTFIVAGIDSSGGPLIRTLSVSGKVLKQFFAFEQTFRGGVSVSTADLGDDGHDEIIVGSGTGRQNEIRIFRTNGSLISKFSPFGKSYTSGINISGADLDGDGKSEIIVSNRAGEPRVKIFGYRNGSYVEVYRSFLAYPTQFQGGVSLIGADVDGDLRDEIITLPYSNGGPNSRIFGLRGTSIQAVGLSVMAFNPKLRTGYVFAAGDFNGNAKDEVAVGIRQLAATHVRILGINRRGKLDVLSPGFFPISSTSRTGVRLSSVDLDFDGKDEISISSGQRAESKLYEYFYNGYVAQLKKQLLVFPSTVTAVMVHDSGTQ